MPYSCKEIYIVNQVIMKRKRKTIMIDKHHLITHNSKVVSLNLNKGVQPNSINIVS